MSIVLAFLTFCIHLNIQMSVYWALLFFGSKRAPGYDLTRLSILASAEGVANWIDTTQAQEGQDHEINL